MRVAYNVEPARVGQRTDFDKLTLEVETNGAIDPRLRYPRPRRCSGTIWSVHYEPPMRRTKKARHGGIERRRLRLLRVSGYDDTPIEELELGVRSYNCLKREGSRDCGGPYRQVRAGTDVHSEFRAQEHRRGARAPCQEQFEAKRRIA